MSNRTCGSYLCEGFQTGVCALAEQIRYQAEHGAPKGGWSVETW